MGNIGGRLRAERERLGFTQADFARIGGQKTQSQGRYESGARFPDAQYLALIADEGADVLFILTGVRSTAGGGAASAAAETRLIELETRLTRGEYLTADQIAEATSIATASGMAERTRAFADKVLRYAGDEAAEERHRDREARRDLAARRAKVRIGDLCARIGWEAPASSESALIRIAVDSDVGDELLEQLIIEMRRLAQFGGS
ncbi:MAG: helix-turn-helix transcriptional regulator [Amphiplicatus sp.]